MKTLLSFLLIGFILVSCGASKKVSSVTFNGGSGLSYESAIIVVAAHEGEGVSAEYKWLAAHYPGYKLNKQSLNNHDGKPYDLMDITTADGAKKIIYFDISRFFGKF